MKKPCGDYGNLIQVKPKSLPVPICQPCRRKRRAENPPRPRPKDYSYRKAECAGGCGRLVWVNYGGALPAGEATCRSCRRAASEAKSYGECPRCGEPILSPYNRTCGRVCGQALWRIERGIASDPETKRLRDRIKCSMRRAQKLATQVERVDPRVVFERDGWRCHLCGKKCRRDVNGLHPLGATIDHIIPLSKGGPHTYENIATAHRECNTRKGARAVGEQLALIG